MVLGHKDLKSNQWASSAGTTDLISKLGIVSDFFFDLGKWAESVECKPSTPCRVTSSEVASTTLLSA